MLCQTYDGIGGYRLSRPRKYTQIHALTGREFERVTGDMTRAEFLELLNRWNRIGAGQWIYFSWDESP